MANPYHLRAARRAAGLTLAAVARAAGTSASNVSAYERGTKTPSAATSARLRAAIEAGAASPIHRYALVTVPAAAAAIRAGLKAGWPTGDLLRVVRELRSNAKHLESTADRELFSSRPSTTGDRRWDGLLAAVAEMDALHNDEPVPDWARGHALPHLWFVGDLPGLHAHALVHSPPSLAARGIVLDAAALESV